MQCTSLTWWRNVDVTEIMTFTVHVTLSPCCRERRQEFIQRCGYPIRQIWIRWTTASGVSFKRGSTVRRSIMWRSWKNIRWASGGCWTTPSSRQRLRSGVVVWMHVFAWMVDIFNISFEPLTFCCVLFVSSIGLLVPLNVIDIGLGLNMCKVLILCEMVTFVSEIFRRYGSNITNVWQEIFTPMTLAFSCEVVYETLWKSVSIC